MRMALKMIGSKERHTFFGTFVRFGIKNGHKGPLKTVLLVNIRNEDRKIVTKHLWFNFTKGFKEADMKSGDIVSFKGRIKPYMKGYIGRRNDVYSPIEMGLSYRISYTS